jgi:hypothetical protein
MLIALRGAAALFVGLRDVAGIAAGPIAHQLAVDTGTTAAGMLQLLQHNHPGTLSEHKAVAMDVEGATGLLRRV